MRRPALVASDLDGTLLDPLQRVTVRTARAVRRVLASGTAFVLVTGRPPRWVPRVAAESGARGVAVCANGAVLYDVAADRVLSSREIEPELLRDVVDGLRSALPECRFAVERVGAGVDEPFLAEPGFGRVGNARAAQLVGRPAVKLLVLDRRTPSAELAAAVSAVVGSLLRVTYSTGAGLLELSAAGVDKSTGLTELTADRGIAPAEVLAFGDMPNDVPMLRWAGHGVAVRGGHPEALSAADEVTADYAHDGVAEVLARWW